MEAIWKLLVFFLIILFGSQSINVAPWNTKNAESKIDLSKGINLNDKFVYQNKNSPRFLFSVSDAQQLKNLGFTYVRIPVEQYIYDQSNNSLVNMTDIENVIHICVQQGLAVTFDFAPTDAITSIIDDINTRNQLVSIWGLLAKEMEHYPANQLAFEIINEPNFSEMNNWYDFMNKSIAAIRTYDKKHTILIDANQWAGIDALASVQPFSDPNVIYVFHFYDPLQFTHQGAGWVWDVLGGMKHLPYPSTPDNVAPIVPTLPTLEARQLATQYGNQMWNKQKIEDSILKVVKWSNTYHVKVVANEFGVYKNYVDPTSRNAWIHDVRSVLEKYNIGWAFWGYDDKGFGLFSYLSNTNTRTLNPTTAAALALNVTPKKMLK